MFGSLLGFLLITNRVGFRVISVIAAPITNKLVKISDIYTLMSNETVNGDYDIILS